MEINKIWIECCKKETFSDWCMFFILWIPMRFVKMKYVNPTGDSNAPSIVLQIKNNSENIEKVRLFNPSENIQQENYGNKNCINIYNILGDRDSYRKVLNNVLAREFKFNKIRFNSNFMEDRLIDGIKPKYNILEGLSCCFVNHSNINGITSQFPLKFLSFFKQGQQQLSIIEMDFKNQKLNVDLNTELWINLSPKEIMEISFYND